MANKINKEGDKIVWTSDAGARLEFPAGTTPTEMAAFIDEYRKTTQQPNRDGQPRIDATKASL